MSTQHDYTSRPLGVLGISEAEERVYRWLLVHSGASAQQITEVHPYGLRKVQQLLNSLEVKGLVTHSPERPRRFLPASPDVAIEALALERHQAVQQAEDMIPDLMTAASTSQHAEQERIVELISSREAESQLFKEIERSTQSELVALMRAPVRVSHLDMPIERDDPGQMEAKARGVIFRSIVDNEYLELEGAVRRVQEDLRQGEEVRVVPHLPLKLILSDRRIALIPLNPDQLDSSLLVIRSSALVDALYELFESIWKRAVPITFSKGRDIEYGTVAASHPSVNQKLITLLALGLNDKAIVGEAGISSATLNRRIAAMMKALGVRTRFQAGWQARGLSLAEELREQKEQD